MTRASSFSIVFDKSNGCYHDGDVVSGFVNLQLIDDLNHKVLKVELHGITTVDLESNKRKSETISPSKSKSEDRFLTTAKILSEGFIPKGSHKFPFEAYLPHNIPSSLCGTYGEIIYKAILVSVHENVSDSIILASEMFTVAAGLDLSFVPEAAARVIQCKYKEIGWCCMDEMVTVKWFCDSSGYVPGDFIYVKTSVDNTSNCPVEICDTILCKIIEYKWGKKKKIEKIEIARGIQESYLKTDGMIEKCEILSVCDTPVTGLCRNSVIDVSYELQFKAELVGSCTLKASSDVYIGSIPIDFELLKLHVATKYNRPHLLKIHPHLEPSAPGVFTSSELNSTSPPPYSLHCPSSHYPAFFEVTRN